MLAEIGRYLSILLALQIAVIIVLALQTFLSVRAKNKARRDYTEMARLAHLAMTAEMTASVAHNVTQPLSAILADIETAQLLLKESTPDLAAVREILADIRKEDLRANHFVESMRLPLRKRELHLERIDINALTAEVLSSVLPEAMRCKVSIRTALDPGLPNVAADRLRLQQVLLNLIDNALDAMSHTPANLRCLHVLTKRSDRHNVTLTVLDTGCGIDAAQAGRMFDSFYTTKQSRLGLGLSLARAIVHMHGGKIWAENRASGGSAFSFTVPVLHKSEQHAKVSHAEFH